MPFTFAQMTDTHTYGPPPKEILETHLNREIESGCSRNANNGGAGEDVPAGLRFPHPERDEVLLAFYKECCDHGVDFVVNTGDLITGGATYERLQYWKGLMDRAVRETGVPFYPVRGNHDVPIRHAEWGFDQCYEDIFGPGTYWFEHKGWAFLIVDEYFATYEHCPSYYTISPDTIERVRALLLEIPRGMPMVMMQHANPVGTSRLHRGETLLHDLRHHNLKLHLFGHVQNNYISRWEGVPYVTVVGEGASFDSAPLTYNIVTCREDGTVECDFFPHVANIPAFPKAPALPEGGDAKPVEDWTDLRGPRGTRATDTPLPSSAPKLAWTAELPGVLAVGSPNLLDGRLVVGTKTNGRFEQCVIRAFDAATGEVQWTTEADAGVEGGVLLADGMGYCGTTAGTVYALHLDDGAVAWRWNNQENYPIACEPTLDGETLHLGANWQIYALHATTGRLAWRKLACDRGLSYFCPGHAKALVAEGRVFHQRAYNAFDGNRQSLLQSVDAATGNELEISHPRYTNFPGQRQSSPVLWEGKIVTVGQGLLAFAPDNLEEALFHAPESSGSTTPAIRDGKAFVSYHREIVCHDLRDGGKVLWRTPHEPARMHFSGGVPWWDVGKDGVLPAGNYSAPLAAGDKVLVCDTGGHCRCLAAADGSELWRLSVDAPILTAPTVSGNTLYFGDYDGNLYAFGW